MLEWRMHIKKPIKRGIFVYPTRAKRMKYCNWFVGAIQEYLDACLLTVGRGVKHVLEFFGKKSK
jgi:hypothetical protein